MSTSVSYRYRLDVTTQKILITESFEAKAKIPHSHAYNELMKLMNVFPGFGLGIMKPTRPHSKNTYKGLNCKKMDAYIIQWEGEDSPNRKKLAKAIRDKVCYPTIKKWFLDMYRDKMNALNEMPTIDDIDADEIDVDDIDAIIAQADAELDQ